jgi:hypothetical protein
MFVVRRPGSRWELRESTLTASGPRSRTLATFRELDDETIRHATARSPDIDPQTFRVLCRRAGAPVAPPRPDSAAAQLLAALARDERPRHGIRRILAGELGATNAPATDSERAAARWLTATPAERGQTLRDLLLLADRLPTRKPKQLAYPRPTPPQ